MRVSNSLAPLKNNLTSQRTELFEVQELATRWTATLRGWIFLPSSSRQVHESWCWTPPLPNSGFGSVCWDCEDDERSDVTPHTQAHRHCLFCCQQHSTSYWSMCQRAKSTSRTSNQVRNKREYRIFCWFLSLLFELECLSRILVLIWRLVCRDFSAVRRISWP